MSIHYAIRGVAIYTLFGIAAVAALIAVGAAVEEMYLLADDLDVEVSAISHFATNYVPPYGSYYNASAGLNDTAFIFHLKGDRDVAFTYYDVQIITRDANLGVGDLIVLDKEYVKNIIANQTH